MAALVFDRVTKSFPHRAGRMLLRERIRELLRGPQGRFEALKGISFTLEPGESFGVVGANGAGKSTLLNLATGLAKPDSGNVIVNGNVAALLELGAGFHPDLTGAENLRINAALSGLTRRETAERFDEIVEFSGIGDFIEEPLRTYSAGMSMRLAFSVAVHTDPEILVMDEVISVGDEAFHGKCLEKIRRFQREGKTILLASHSLEQLKELCQRAMWLDHGRVVRIGPVKEVVDAYHNGAAALAAG